MACAMDYKDSDMDLSKGLSLRTIPRACERESEAISSKSATDIRDSSFRPDSRDFFQNNSPEHVNCSAAKNLFQSGNGHE